MNKHKYNPQSKSVKIIAEYTADEILDNVPNSNVAIIKKIYAGHLIKLSAERLRIFKKNRVCVCCGIVGTKMHLEQPQDSLKPHFNLYAEELGTLVLMTKDHIIPISHPEGTNDFDNYQTMCVICNNIKADSNPGLDKLKAARIFFNQLHNDGNNKAMAIAQELVNDNSVFGTLYSQVMDGGLDLSSYVHEAKVAEAKEINASGVWHQYKYLFNRCGNSYIKKIIGQ